MKRILSLMLCLLMLVPMLASCGKDEEETEMVETATRKAVTLNMFVITEDETKPEAAQTVEDAVKTMIKSKYTTNLEIEFLTESEYYKTIEGRLAGMEKNASASRYRDRSGNRGCC